MAIDICMTSFRFVFRCVVNSNRKTVHQTHTEFNFMAEIVSGSALSEACMCESYPTFKTDIGIGCALNMRKRRRKCNKAQWREKKKRKKVYLIADGITSAENQIQDAILWYRMGNGIRCQYHGFCSLLFYYFPLCDGWTYATHIEITLLLIFWTLLVFFSLSCSLFVGDSAVIFYEI